ncbi:hypothetical protein Misp03_69880 [Microbispora sp. NBRC 16548]|nr:hypothetical protein Misp03_69880 [Microbispora sp. NBRC 16548]
MHNRAEQVPAGNPDQLMRLLRSLCWQWRSGHGTWLPPPARHWRVWPTHSEPARPESGDYATAVPA